MITTSKIEELIRRLKRDDKSALDELFNYYYPRLFQFSKSILKIEHEIDDVLQEVFYKLWINRFKIDNPVTFNSYIFTITRNEVLNLMRSNIRNQSFRDELFSKAVADENITDNQYEFEEVRTAIERMVDRLPEKRKQVFLLSRNEGLPNKEIAQKLNISEKTVEDHITHSLRFLKSSMKEAGFLSLLYIYLFL